MARQMESLPTWEPDRRNEPQCTAVASLADETLYGGAAGGAKTNTIVCVPLAFHQNSILFRRNYGSIEETFVPESHLFYGNPKNYVGSPKYRWALPNNKRVRFAHLEREDSVLKYKSGAWDFIGFDELSEFTRSQYLYMLSRNRS